VFESVLKVKGFTVIKGPADVMQIIPVREAKESNIQTIRDARPSENRDHFVTRLIPLLYIDAQAITNTIKPLVSKDASMVAYAPTNTIILTDTATNIRRLLTILEAIDVETFREELAVIKIEHADASTLGQQISEIYEAEVTSASKSSTAASRARSARRNRASAATTTVQPQASRGRVRIITDERTNTLLILAARGKLEDIRELIRSLDVPVIGGGRIHVYYLKHADAEELAQTLNGLLSGTGRSSGRGGAGATGAGAQPQALRATVSALAEGITLNADPATNSLVIQASKEAYATLLEVIERLDIERPQVLVEALIMEVNVTGGQELGMNTRLILDSTVKLGIQSATDAATQLASDFQDGESATATAIASPLTGISAFGANFLYNGGGTTIQAILRASASDSDTNIVAAPHILTSDNEEAEIQIGQNIPIITNRINNATGNVAGQSTSVAVERQDVGVILRVTPQISEGDSLRLKIFQENTTVIQDAATGDPNEVGVSLSKRAIENTLVVADGQTVVIGGLLSEEYTDSINKTPFLGDIPLLGWLFKTTTKSLRKVNLLVFLTPHIIRSPAAMERESIRKRRQFEQRLGGDFLTSGELSRDEEEQHRSKNPVISVLGLQSRRYPLSRMREIEEEERRETQEAEERRRRALDPDLYIVNAGLFRDDQKAAERLQLLLDRGYEATLTSGETDGRLAFELRVGPYESLREATQVGNVLAEAFSFDTSVELLPRQEGQGSAEDR